MIRISQCLCLLVSLASMPVFAELTSPFSEDLKTGEHFSFQQKDHYFSNYLKQDIRYRLDYTRWQPKKSNGQVIIYNHGMQSHRAWFNSTAEALSELGYTVYAFDRIGSGTSSKAYGIHGYPLGLEDFTSLLTDVEILQLRGHIHDYEIFLDSIDLMIEIAKSEQPEKPIHLWANSYGAKIITRYLLDQNRADKVRSAIFTTPGLFRNTSSMPLPFSKIDLFLSKNTDEFPSPVTPVNNDNGANWFTDMEPWVSKISNDPLSVRSMTRKMALQTQSMDRYIENNISGNSAISSVPRFYLLVKGDAMMDNRKVLKHVETIKTASRIKFYEGGSNHKHFLTFTPDAQQAISDIHGFISQHITHNSSVTQAIHEN